MKADFYRAVGERFSLRSAKICRGGTRDKEFSYSEIIIIEYTPELSMYWYIYVQCSALGPKYFSAHTTGTTAAIKAMLELTPVDAGHTTCA